MDFPLLGIHSPTALTRTVQSILSPCLYNGSANGLSVIPHSLPWTPVTVKTEDSVKIEEDEIITDVKTECEEKELSLTFDSYSEIVDKVARNYNVDKKVGAKRPKERTPPKLKKRSMKKDKVSVKVKKRRLCANPALLEAPLIVKEHLSTFQSNGRDQMWWFILKVLMDPSNRQVVAWTGQYYSFRVIDKELFTQMWCDYNYRSRIIAWSSVCRAMRLCYGDKGILTPVSQRDRVWAFVVDISIPLMMSREAIQEYIDEHREIPPKPIFFDANQMQRLREFDMNGSANEIKMVVPLPCISRADSPLCEVESGTHPPPSPSLLPFSPLKLDFSNRPPLTSPLFWTDSSTINSHISPLPSPYWLPVPHTPILSCFRF